MNKILQSCTSLNLKMLMDTVGVVEFLHERDLVAEYVENMKCQTTAGQKSHPTMWII